ncbi:hypothetical protein DPMN_095397 [Dreissena polymorpha]|uniref:Uncharacterized protein n=1 Tax=Dreissena polymorpha TaxID=45954 RepID=A0A9D4L7A7_DREPO|nr:hypothetical protein DPMN_095397 [Dreissena polymorpha]
MSSSSNVNVKSQYGFRKPGVEEFSSMPKGKGKAEVIFDVSGLGVVEIIGMTGQNYLHYEEIEYVARSNITLLERPSSSLVIPESRQADGADGLRLNEVRVTWELAPTGEDTRLSLSEMEVDIPMAVLENEVNVREMAGQVGGLFPKSGRVTLEDEVESGRVREMAGQMAVEDIEWPRNAAPSALVIGHADPGGTKVVNGLDMSCVNGEECGGDRFDSTVRTPNAVTSGK